WASRLERGKRPWRWQSARSRVKNSPGPVTDIRVLALAHFPGLWRESGAEPRFCQLMAARFTRQRRREQAAAPVSFFSQDQELRDHRRNRSYMLQAVADSPRHRKLVLPESTLWHSTRTV